MTGEIFQLPPRIAEKLGPELAAALCELIDDSIHENDALVAAASLKFGLSLLCGPTKAEAEAKAKPQAKAQAAVDMLLRVETRSDAEVARSLGETPAALCKRHNKIRENLGSGPTLRYPKNARAGAKPKGAAPTSFDVSA